jgi:hypothetical protein
VAHVGAWWWNLAFRCQLVTRRPVPNPAPVRAALQTLAEGYVGIGALP